MANLIARPSDAELLAWLDGDLSPERRAEVARLLELDWEVRAQLASLERCIEAYVRIVPPPPGEEPEPFDQVWQRLSPRWQAESGEREEVAGLPADTPSGTRRWLVAGLLVSLCVGCLLLLFWRGQNVSAEELLDRAATREATRVRVLAQPVIYHKLEVERLGENPERIQLESWKDLAHNRVRQRVVDRDGPRFLPVQSANAPARALESPSGSGGAIPPLLDELERVLAASEFDLANPLSPVAFAEWREGVAGRRDDLQVEGEGMAERIRLTTSTVSTSIPNGIWQASLLVRRQDWHPVALSLSVGTPDAATVFAIRELAYELVPLEALTVFTEGIPPALAPALDEAREVGEKSEGTGEKALLPSLGALWSAEVTALFALHQVRADLGEQIEISRTERQILVTGVVQSSLRRDELIDALRGLPLVQAEIRTLEEALASLSKVAPRAPSTSPGDSDVASAEQEILVAGSDNRDTPRPPVLQQRLTDLLRAGGGGREADPAHAARWVAQSFTAIEADASGALAEARALFRLDENYRDELTLPLMGGAIDPAARRRLEETERNLLFRLRQRWRSLTGRLQPILGPLPESARGGPLVPPVADGSRREQISRLFNAFARSSRLTDRLLVVSDPAVFQSVAEGLLVELATIEWMLDRLEID